MITRYKIKSTINVLWNKSKLEKFTRWLSKVQMEKPVLYRGAKALLTLVLYKICPVFFLFRFSYLIYTIFFVLFIFCRVPVAYCANSDSFNGPSTTVTMGDMTVYRAPSPGSHCEIFEIPGSPQEVRGIPNSSFELPLPERTKPIVQRNKSIESSLFQRVKNLENQNSLFLPQLEKGEFWTDIKIKFDSALTKEEYEFSLEFESWDLRIRELRQQCASILKGEIQNSNLFKKEEIYINPVEAIKDFFDEQRANLEEGLDPIETFDSHRIEKKEVEFLINLLKDLSKKKGASFFVDRILKDFMGI